MHYQHLAVTTAAGPYAYYRYAHLAGHTGGQIGRDFLYDYCETAYLLEHSGISHEFGSLGLFAGTHGVSAKFVDTLRRKPQMSAHGYASAQYALYTFAYFGTTLQLDGLGMALFHDTYGGCQSLLGITLVCSERQVYYH